MLAPPPGVGSARIQPPCASTIAFAMASPKLVLGYPGTLVGDGELESSVPRGRGDPDAVGGAGDADGVAHEVA